MPDTDPALPIVMAIVRVVPASRWAFARIKPSGALTSVLSSQAGTTDLGTLTRELGRQRAKVKLGPRIGATLDALGEFESGVTLVFADARTDFGILTLWRDANAGLFSSAEVALLTFALDSASDRLSALRMNLEPRLSDRTRFEERATAADSDALYVLDLDLRIVLECAPYDDRRVAGSGLRTSIAERLPSVLEACVRDLTSGWHDGEPRTRGTARPVPFLIVHALPMSGRDGPFVAVRVERVLGHNSLADAAARFRLSPREVQVLALLFDGCHLDEISHALHITSSTVQDHIRSMVGKTESRNRSELIAHVLGWEYEPSPMR